MCCIQESLVELLKQSDLSEVPEKSEISMEMLEKCSKILFFNRFFPQEAFNADFNAGIRFDILEGVCPSPHEPPCVRA